jgi:hypothetical protein
LHAHCLDAASHVLTEPLCGKERWGGGKKKKKKDHRVTMPVFPLRCTHTSGIHWQENLASVLLQTNSPSEGCSAPSLRLFICSPPQRNEMSRSNQPELLSGAVRGRPLGKIPIPIPCSCQFTSYPWTHSHIHYHRIALVILIRYCSSTVSS